MKRSTSRVLVTLSAAALAVLACSAPTPSGEQDQGGSLRAAIADYHNWAGFPGHEGIQPGDGTHGNFIRTFVNATAAASIEHPLPGSIIVKEAYETQDEQSMVELVAMQKVAGSDPENGNWIYALYRPDGTLTASGSVAKCCHCHSRAEGGDYVFLNDD